MTKDFMARIAGRVFQAILVSPRIEAAAGARGVCPAIVAGARTLLLITGLWGYAMTAAVAHAQTSAASPAPAAATSAPAAAATPAAVSAAPPAPATPSTAAPAATVSPTAAANSPTGPTYEVTGIHVDVTADNAAAARDKALEDGARQALQQFVEQWVPADKRARYARMPQQQIEDMIADFSIRDEKASSVRYIATLDYRLKPSRASRLLRDAGVVVPLLPGETPPPPPIIVIPVMETDIPGSGGDPWRGVWQGIATRRPDRYVVARADSSVAGDQAQLAALVRRMGGDSGFVAVATPTILADGTLAGLDVVFLRQGRSRQASGRVSFTPTEGEAQDAFLRRAAAGTEAAMLAAWKQAVVTPSRAQLAAWVPVQSLGDWLKMEKALRQVEGVRKVELTMMTRREMLVSVSYTGSIEELRANLEDADLTLFESGGRQVIAPDTSPLVPVVAPEPAPTGASPGLPHTPGPPQAPPAGKTAP